MPVRKMPNPSEEMLSETAQALSEIARKLATHSTDNDAEARSLEESREALLRLSQKLENWRAQEEKSATETVRLRQKILDALARGGPALPIELAAATLSLPEEVQPVLEELERDDLIQIRGVKGGQLVSLTARGRMEVRH